MNDYTREHIDRDRLVDELKLINIMYLYDFMCPLDYSARITAEEVVGRNDAGVRRYHNDAMFYARVNNIVAHTMKIVDRHIDRLIKKKED